MRQQVFDETKLTVSAGIAANKVCLNRFRTNSLMSIGRILDVSQGSISSAY
jgi:nucleotidyltransferase/DNA polymerase involved in DNA repair